MPQADSIITPRCPIRTSLELIGGKWRLILLQRLAKGPKRFTELRRELSEISEKVLTAELRSLVDAALIKRTTESDGAVYYERLPLADLADPVIKCLVHFGLAYSEELFGAPTNGQKATSSQGPPR